MAQNRIFSPSCFLITDVSYFSISPDDAAGPLGGTISTNIKMPLINAYYGRKWGSDERYGALLVGVRYMKNDVKLTLRPNLPSEPVIVSKEDPGFTDFLVGGMFQKSLNDTWSMMLQGDVGAGGSNNSWSALMMFNHKNQSGNSWSVGARYMSVDFDDVLSNGELFVMDVDMAGLVFAYTWD